VNRNGFGTARFDATTPTFTLSVICGLLCPKSSVDPNASVRAFTTPSDLYLKEQKNWATSLKMGTLRSCRGAKALPARDRNRSTASSTLQSILKIPRAMIPPEFVSRSDTSLNIRKVRPTGAGSDCNIEKLLNWNLMSNFVDERLQNAELDYSTDAAAN
jgi:hypothetical protein